MSEHPSDREIDQFVRHVLPAAAVLRVDDHLTGCEACRRRALRAGGAGLVELEDDFVPAGRRSTLETRASFAPTLVEHAPAPVTAGSVRTARPAARWLLTAAAVLFAAGLGVVAARFALTGRGDASNPPSSTVAARPDVAGLEALTETERRLVVDALHRGYAEPPASLARPPSGALMGGPSVRPAFAPLAPLHTVTIADRPVFRWQALADAREYVVTVTDGRFTPVREGTTRETHWTPAVPLPRGATYRWQVTALRGADSLTAPAPPQPEAAFTVMDAESAQRLQKLTATHPNAHLVRGLLYLHAGARDEAEDELGRVAATDAYAPVAATTLSRLRHAAAPLVK